MIGTKEIEIKLINFAQELSKLEEKKKPKWCPVIYLENSVTGGLDAIKIKNAYK